MHRIDLNLNADRQKLIQCVIFAAQNEKAGNFFVIYDGEVGNKICMCALVLYCLPIR